MTIYVATKTLAAFEECVRRDQGSAYRVNLGRVLPHIGDAYRPAEFPFREHLGASLIGGKCGRAIWYGWRWHTQKQFSGQLLRLFNRGHLEEGRVIALMLTAGIQVFQQDENGKQYRISDGAGHYGGSGDGVALGVPDLPEGVYALLEFKTHNQKSFDKMKAEGVREAKFEHYCQMNQYMGKMGLVYALYVAVCKNTDEIYAEVVPFDANNFNQLLERARNTVIMKQVPPRISDKASPGWFDCKWCDHKDVCFGQREPVKTCRSCTYSEPVEGGKWLCRFHVTNENDFKELSRDEQYAGCQHWEQIK